MTKLDPIDILIVDDEPETAELISQLLKRKCSARTQAAIDCKSAMEKIRSSHFDLITLDYQLPDGTGLKLLKEIKALDDPVPVVMVTGHGDENTAVEAFRLGVSGYVIKDARINVMLVEEVKSALVKVELKRAEKALIESEERYSQMFQKMSSAVAVHKVVGDADDFILVDLNKAGERIEKIDRNENIGKCFYEIFPLARGSGVFETFQRVWKTGITEALPLVSYVRHGIPEWKEGFVYKLPGRQIVAIWDDVTEIKRLEEMMKSILDSIPEAITFLDNRGNVIYVNRATRERFKETFPDESTIDDLRGQQYKAYIAGTDIPYPKERSVVDRALKGETSIIDDVEMDVKGKRVPLEAAAIPIFGPDGAVSNVIVTSRDISRQKETEEGLIRTNAELDAYAHTVSHDLKGPLSSLELTADLLGEMLKGKVDEGASDMIDIMARNASIALSRTENLLKLAESGQVPDEVELVDIGSLVKVILRILSSRINEKGVKVTVVNRLGSIIANKIQMEQVFLNLITNAIKHNDNVKPEIEISRLATESEKIHKYLIRDNGSGIPPEEMENIFTPFHGMGKTGETGIGLSIARKIANVYGGDIKAYNDNGACFEVTIIDFESNKT